MPRFFFHVRDGEVFEDLQGTELPTMVAAKNEAVRFAGQLLQDKPETFWQGHEWTVNVTDDANLTLFRLTFFATSGAHQLKEEMI